MEGENVTGLFQQGKLVEGGTVVNWLACIQSDFLERPLLSKIGQFPTH